MIPMRQVVRQTTSAGVMGAPAVLVELLTGLGFCWHPEYTVYEEFHDFNQEQCHAKVCIFSPEEHSTTVLHTANGVGVTVDMAIHDVAFACLTRLRREYRQLEDSPFRHAAIASSEGEGGYYTGIYTPLSRDSRLTHRF